MLSDDFNALTSGSLRWLSQYSNLTLAKWKFKQSQIGLISDYSNKAHITPTPPPFFFDSFDYLGAHYPASSAELRLNYLSESNIFTSPGLPPIFTFNSSEEDTVLDETIDQPELEEIIEPNETIANSLIIVESAHDLQVKYLNTYGLKDSIAVYITLIESKSGPSTHIIYYSTIEPDLSMSSKISYNIGEFNMTLPKIGMINTDNTVILIERKHKRESPYRYRKALVSDSLNIFNISKNSIKELGIPDLYDPCNYGNKAVIQRLLYDLYYPKRFTYEEALSLVDTGVKISCAFSQSLAIGACFTTNKIYLYKNQWILGTYLPKKESFLLLNNYFSSELDKYGVKYECA